METNFKKILVPGGNGFLGKHTVKKLEDQHAFKSTNLILSNIYGPSDHFDGINVIMLGYSNLFNICHLYQNDEVRNKRRLRRYV